MIHSREKGISLIQTPMFLSASQFPKARILYCSYLKNKGNKLRRGWERITSKEIHDSVLRFAVLLPVPLPEALVGLPLPLPREIVTADVSLVAMRAPWCPVGEGGGK